MTTLRQWLDRLKTFDPDDWEEIGDLYAEFTEEELSSDIEAKIAFATVRGNIYHVSIYLLDKRQDIIVALDYTMRQIDLVALTNFINESAEADDAPPAS